jgi:hypothetical protein
MTDACQPNVLRLQVPWCYRATAGQTKVASRQIIAPPPPDASRPIVIITIESFDSWPLWQQGNLFLNPGPLGS